MRQGFAVALMILALSGCAMHTPRTPVASPPVSILGEFEDDYGNRFTISRDDFFQQTRNHFAITKWNVAEGYLIAHNGSSNASAAGSWTRIDWVMLDGMQPYTWAFCFSSYDAASAAEAEAVKTVQRSTPRTGCSGYPFSRMKRIQSAR